MSIGLLCPPCEVKLARFSGSLTKERILRTVCVKCRKQYSMLEEAKRPKFFQGMRVPKGVSR